MSISCEVARDLIPLCADKTASRDSLCAVREHIKDCEECGKFYKDCRRSVKSEKTSEELASDAELRFGELSRRLRRRRYRRIVIAAVLATAAAACIARDIYAALFDGKKHK